MSPFLVRCVVVKHDLNSVDCKVLWWRGYDITGDDISDVKPQLLMWVLTYRVMAPWWRGYESSKNNRLHSQRVC